MANDIGAPTERTQSDGRQPTGFGAKIPGMKTAPVEHKVRQKTRAEMQKTPDVWKAYNDLSRTMRIINRAEHGPMKNKAFSVVHNSEIWPDGADREDESTWLQPGEYMDVPKDVALHICGNIWDPRLPDKSDIIHRYGDFEYEPTAWGQGSGRMPKAVPVGPPPIPDIIVCELDGRSQPKSEYKEVYALYTKGLRYNGRNFTETELAKPVETFERVKVTA